MQDPSTKLRMLCGRIRSQLDSHRHLLIIDDIWPEDFPLFEREWLAVDDLHGGSACILTSRENGNPCSHYKVVPLRAMDEERAQCILLGHADPNANPPDETLGTEIQVCRSHLR
jgi:hypothetical protein